LKIDKIDGIDKNDKILEILRSAAPPAGGPQDDAKIERGVIPSASEESYQSMQLILLEESEKFQYDQFIANQESGSFLQSWEWGEWQEHLGRKVTRYKLQDTGPEWVGAFQAIEIPIGNRWSYIYIPYGPIISDKFQIPNDKFQINFKSQFPKAVFIRIEPKDNFKFQISNFKKTKNIQPGKTLVVNLSKSEEELLAQMHHKTRYNIKVAQKHGVAVMVGTSQQAIGLIAETSSRHGFTSHPESYYQKLVDQFRDGSVAAKVYSAEYEGKIITSAIMVDFGNMRTYLFGGSSHEYKNVMAPYLLHWQAMLDAKKEGLATYDFWGIETASGETPGFVRFKLGFGGNELQYAGAYDIVNKPFLYWLYGIMRAVNRIFRNI
jgi:peptidoglycan pentaglycine glycine transferase (the first glycine)